MDVLYNFNVLNVNHYGQDHYLEWIVLMVVFVYFINAIHGFVFFFEGVTNLYEMGILQQVSIVMVDWILNCYFFAW